MTTYYVSSSGNDLNAGTRSAPFKTISRVNHLTLTDGDRVRFMDSDHITPYRGELRANKAASAMGGIRYIGDQSGGAFIAGSWDVSEGAIVEWQDKSYSLRTDTEKNLGFDVFSAGVIQSWTRLGVTAGATQETSQQLTGYGSCLRLDHSGGLVYVQQSFLMVNGKMRLTVTRKNGSGGTLAIDLRAMSDSAYAQLASDGTFSGYSETLSRPVLPNTLSWADWSTGWISRDMAAAVPSRVQILSNTGVSYVQRLKIEYLCEWKTHDAVNRVYFLPVPFGTAKTYTLQKCTRAAWAVSGWSALEYVHDASSLAAIKAGTEPGKAWFADTENRIYYQAPVGETLADMHLEFSGSAFNSIYVTGANSWLMRLHARGAFKAGIEAAGVAYRTYQCSGKYNRGHGLLDRAAATATHHLGNFDWNGRAWDGGPYPGPLASDGQLVDGVGTSATFIGCTANDNGDDGWQNDSGGTLTMRACEGVRNWSEQCSISGGPFDAQACTFGKFSTAGWTDQVTLNDRSDLSGNDAAYTRRIVDCYIQGISGSAVRIGADAAGKLTASGNVVVGTISDTGAQTFTNQPGRTTDTVGLDANLLPQGAGSTGGSKWWGTGPRPTAPNGQPVAESSIAKTGRQPPTMP